MGDTMRDDWLPEPFFRTSKTGGAYSIEQMRAAHEAGRQQGMEQARREERERIAQLVDPIANDIAAAIRNS